MTTTGEFAAERAQLGSRDRDELHEIASAMGVRGATRLRKADLIEAILDKATSGASVPEPTGEKPKKRATRKKAAEAETAAPADSGEGDEGGAKAQAPTRAEAEGREAAPEPTRAAAEERGGSAEAAAAGDSGGAESQRLSFEGGSATTV
ncbi:MAG TPA: Rho termination factor N-terminal domain-containing protein, partial [Acidimicrobiia bacterium]|nr:Rho termination factor N-terminal domain-containing protein [Acidimicrobiia bacterium]